MTKKKGNKDGKKMFRLSDLQVKATYEAPANYFEELPGEVVDHIDQLEERAKKPVMKNWWVIGVAIAAAACLLLFYIFPMMQTKEESQDLLSGVSEQEIIAYLINSDLNTDEIIAELSTGGFELDIEMMQFDVSDEEAEVLLEYYTL
ncbi:MAG: hypothetical protein ACJAT1_000766 [Marivirga sp.]|jgi:hypothetical protein